MIRSEKSNDIFEYDEIFESNCMCCFLRVYKLEDDNEIYVSKLTENHTYQTFFQRIILAVKYVFNPYKFDLSDTAIFDNKVANSLGRSLIKIAAKKDKNIITGSV